MQNISVQDALKLILKNISPTQTETIPITEVSSRILAEDLESKITNPPFDTSAMDGYAVHREDIIDLPILLKIVGEARAGSAFDGFIEKRECVRIFTGAPLPAGADHIVIQENTERNDNFIKIINNNIASSNIRKRGCDFIEEKILLHKGSKLNSRSIMLAAAMGHSALCVQKKPIIAILATGDELAEPSEVPNPNQIICSNSYGILSLVQSSGAQGVLLGIARDTQEELITKFSKAEGADIIVTSGGVSVGDYDLVTPAFQSLGMKVQFWNISMKPGKPMLYGRIGKQIILGLPGNPISALLTARIFLVPLIEKLLNFKSSELTTIRAQLTMSLEENGPRTHYMRAHIIKNSNGDFLVTPQTSQDSSLVSQFARANVLIIREAHAPKVEQNSLIDVHSIDF